MPPNPSAEEVANDLIATDQHKCGPHLECVRNADLCMIKERIAKALETYATAKVQEAIFIQINADTKIARDECRQARNQALEEAAKVVIDYRTSGKFETGHGFMTDLDEIAITIRHLKSPTPEENA